MNSFVRVSVLVLALTVALLASFPGIAGDNDKAQKIDRLISTYYQYGQFNGTALVAENGRVILKKGYGMANMEWDIPNAPDTKFRIGSTTKQFTSMLVLQQVEHGKLRLEGHISDHLPYYRRDTGGKVTIHQLLSHTSGIPNYSDKRDPYEPEDFVKKYCSGELEFVPGTKFKYDNAGYFLLGAILEQVTGKIYEQLLKENILNPVGMKNTGYDHHATLLPKRATGYFQTLGGFENAAYIDMSIPYAAGSLYSTVEDLFLWDRALYGNTLLPEKLKDLLFKPTLQNYGYGWFIKPLAGNEAGAPGLLVQHPGGINGFTTIISRMIRDRNCIVLLANTSSARVSEIAANIRNVLYQQEIIPPRRSLAVTLGQTIVASGIDAAIVQYTDLKNSHTNEYPHFSDMDLSDLGGTLLMLGRIRDAIAILKLNVAEYPKSASVYDNLAEAYIKDGQKRLAIENYRKAMKIDPDNKNRQATLQKLTKD